ncbi:zf-HC2 domain-containing protein [Clostridium sp. MD294]|uniref:zf-HC2 domain-containing protein n=1 Tax=Clostridium sp. MD294 TaxID=97138 RepID=UPI0002C97898|nr:zf-HC2 domain-containing protein [Clostridium sp. MD294]NDO45922.1 hypothetical protein [Clostridium sp. MD294]USF30419.1 hypothetical protein C820_001860 [Clostridium sp. MD294]
MKCENREEKISLYIDRQLDWKEEKEFLKHIKQCPECKKALQQAQQLRQMLLEMPMEKVPQGLHQNIMEAINKEMETKAKTKVSPLKKTKNIAWQKYVAVAASFLVLAGVSKVYFHNKTDVAENAQTAEIASIQLQQANVEQTEVEQQQISPTITQTRSVKAPETAKALPATPALTAAGSTEDDVKDVEGGEEQQVAKEQITQQQKETTQQKEILQQYDENDNGNELQHTQQDIMIQPMSAGEDKEDKEDKKEKMSTESDETESIEDAITNTVRKSVPANMKSKSLQISLKSKNEQKIAQDVEKRTKSLKGEIETHYAENSMTVKIPISEYNDIVNWLGQQCEIINKNEIVEDLGKQYKEIQQQLEQAKQIEKQATQKEQPRKAQEARKTQKECEKALEELQKTADFATIHITFVE